MLEAESVSADADAEGLLASTAFRAMAALNEHMMSIEWKKLK